MQIVARTLTITPAGQSKVWQHRSVQFRLHPQRACGGRCLDGGLPAQSENVATYAYAIGTLALRPIGNYSLTLAPETFAITTLGIDVTASVHKTYGEAIRLSYSVTPSRCPATRSAAALPRIGWMRVYAITRHSRRAATTPSRSTVPISPSIGRRRLAAISLSLTVFRWAKPALERQWWRRAR